MRRKLCKLLVLSIVTILYACGIEEVEKGRRPSMNDAWRNPSINIDTSANARKVCYITALDYPKGYDWRADCETGTVKCSLVVFADGVPAMKVAVGNEYNVSPDPDMHRVIKGQLYTDFSTERETVIKCDGRELFRYEGRESLLGFTISGGDIYTLGRPRNGEGFAYRRNGEIILERSSGRAFAQLQNDSDSISFAFCEHIETADGKIERYYRCMNGRVSQIAVREDVKKVWDVIVHKGQICYLADMVGISSPVLVKGGSMKAMDISSNMKLISCRLIPAGDAVVIEGICSSGLLWTSGLWKDGKKYKMFEERMTVSDICTSDDGICCLLKSSTEGKSGNIFRCGDSYAIPEGYASMGNNPMVMVDGILNVGFSSLSGGRPLIWKDGRTTELEVNGLICTMCLQ